MSEQSVPRREHCPNFIPIIVGNGNDEINSETVPLLNGNNIEEYNSIIPLDIVLAALLTIILTLAILSGIYLIIEGEYLPIHFQLL